MKSNTKIFLLILLALAMVFSGCDGLMGGGEPVITGKTITNISDENYPKDDDGNPKLLQKQQILDQTISSTSRYKLNTIL